MLPHTAARLIELNRRFYHEHGESFAATRRRIQPGVRRVLDRLPDSPGQRWLDLGCGSGALAVEWLRRGRRSAYLGLDFSEPLLAEAHRALAGLPGAEQVSFARADLANPDWAATLEVGWSGGLAFAVLHHLPGRALRERVLRQVAALLAPGGLFVYSVWQFQHSPKLLARVQPWSAAGLEAADLEPGDALLDWRAPGQQQGAGLRYVHRFSADELRDLAAQAGLAIVETFESDGQGGRLGLYQVLEKT
jgi:SAM-dependent methyltransferase